jgi:Reverse transcriptase (RNA-dependent DNA polymerase)
VTSHWGQGHLQTQAFESEEYTLDNAKIIAMTINKVNHQFAQTYSLMRGIKTFGDKGRQAAHEEMKQLHDRVVFKPIAIEKLSSIEKRRAMESLIFLTEKKDGRIKARTCANGSTQREYTDREEAASPTALTESNLITAVIDAKQGRDVMTADIPNAFVQTEIEEKKNGEKIIMKIRGTLVDMLVDIAPHEYTNFVRHEGNHKVLYVEMKKALYGMLQSSLLYYKKFRKDLEGQGFVINPYDPCVANRTIKGKQQTVTWHVDDLKSSHVDPRVNDKFLVWLKTTYANDEIGKIKAVRGKKHDYLAMTLDFSSPGVLKVDMTSYVNRMIEDFPEELSGKSKCPWSDNLFKVEEESPKLTDDKAKIFHTFVMKGMFLCKRARQDLLPGIVFLATRVKEPNQKDWMKLLRIMNFLKATKGDVARMSADDTQTIKWYVDSSFAVHKDMRSHTGAVMTLGRGAIISDSTKQKVNARSSTESEMVAADDTISKVLWTKRFIEAQGHKVNANIVYQDNTSAMKLENNGKASSGKRTRHFDIKFFYIQDLIKRGELKVEYCPTDEMDADYMTKPLVGAKFIKFRSRIMDAG